MKKLLIIPCLLLVMHASGQSAQPGSYRKTLMDGLEIKAKWMSTAERRLASNHWPIEPVYDDSSSQQESRDETDVPPRNKKLALILSLTAACFKHRLT